MSSSLAAALANGEALLSGQRRAEEEGRELRAAMMAMMDGEKIKREDEWFTRKRYIHLIILF